MIREGITFDDVLLVPKYSTIESRSKINMSVNMDNLEFKHPIIPANMKTVTGIRLAEEIIKSGGLAILHRFMPIEEQLSIANSIIDNFGDRHLAVSVGVKKDDIENIHSFLEVGVRIFCIDIAHGDSEQCIDMIINIKNINPDVFIIAGNVATGVGAKRLWVAGADAVKVGIGPGSLCTTRVETGNGVPQLTALMDVSEMRAYLITNNFFDSTSKTKYIIADGGIKNAGDCVKALCFADMVMAGNLFAGCPETPGKTILINNQQYKEYVGSSTHKTNHIEGVSAMVLQKPPYKEILDKLLEGIRSGCSYQGVKNLKDLQDHPQFIKISNSGLVESHPHDITIRK